MFSLIIMILCLQIAHSQTKIDVILDDILIQHGNTKLYHTRCNKDYMIAEDGSHKKAGHAANGKDQVAKKAV